MYGLIKMVTKSYGNDIEIIKFKADNTFTVTVEIFKGPEGFNSFAYNSIVHHYDLSGNGKHKEKKASIQIALKDLSNLMEQY